MQYNIDLIFIDLIILSFGKLAETNMEMEIVWCQSDGNLFSNLLPKSGLKLISPHY